MVFVNCECHPKIIEIHCIWHCFSANLKSATAWVSGEIQYLDDFHRDNHYTGLLERCGKPVINTLEVLLKGKHGH